ncbi:hypothetical protein R5R35_005035 [Gryllus longicercus]|uniref:Uncharacterized protein n=1 Tax=Gryllus longicercus TaxID=2509291 RepID=A0AAN9ZAZ3_9ORTH
MQLATRQK